MYHLAMPKKINKDDVISSLRAARAEIGRMRDVMSEGPYRDTVDAMASLVGRQIQWAEALAEAAYIAPLGRSVAKECMRALRTARAASARAEAEALLADVPKLVKAPKV